MHSFYYWNLVNGQYVYSASSRSHYRHPAYRGCVTTHCMRGNLCGAVSVIYACSKAAIGRWDPAYRGCVTTHCGVAVSFRILDSYSMNIEG